MSRRSRWCPLCRACASGDRSVAGATRAGAGKAGARGAIALVLVLLAGCLYNAGPPPRATSDDDAGATQDAGAQDGGSTAHRFRVATFNVHRFFDTVCQSGACGPGDYEEQPSQADFDAKADQLAIAIRGFDADVVMLQEVETQACLDALEARLSNVLPSAVLGETGGTASVDVAILAREPITSVVTHRQQVLTRPDGTTTTFSREFLEVHLAGDDREVIAFAAHFRSKVNDDPGRRLAEAQAAHDIVAEVARASPDALVVMAGDLNDVPGSPPLDALESDGALLRVARELPVAAQGTYDFNGDWQAIDHILQATAARGVYVGGSAHVIRGNPGYAGSDHDPLLADFDLSR